MTIESAKIASDIQYLSLDPIVDMFELDATTLGANQVYYFTRSTKAGATVVFNGVTYYPLDFEVEGFDISTSGQLPEPKIRMSNVNNAIGAVVIELNDLVGATITRRRTFEKYLDGELGADPTAQFPIEKYMIDRKTIHNKYMIEFSLVSFFDYTRIRIPKRQVLRSSCNFIYRYYDTVDEVFVYTRATCPYTDSTYYDIDGDVTLLPAEDNCGKRLEDCLKRFASETNWSFIHVSIPFGGFPAVARYRTK